MRAMGGSRLLQALNVFSLCIAVVPVFAVHGESPPQSEVVDAFKVFSQFTDAAGVRDVNRDSMFKCLRANRTEYDPDVPSTTYVWSLNAGKGKPRKHAVVEYIAGDTPDAFITTVDSDPSTRAEGRLIYSDYENCGISVIESLGYQCTLWVAFEKRYSYPEVCNEIHKELCGKGVSLFDKKFCEDIEAY